MEIKKKWNNVRDCYRRDVNKIKNTPTGSSSTKPKKYVYSDILSFLAPVMQSRSHEGNYCAEDTLSSTEEVAEESKNKSDIENDERVDKASNINRKSSNKRPRKDDVLSEILTLLKERKQNPNKENDDDDTKFLLSFRSDMKAMTKRQKLDFRIGMLQLLKNICEPNNLNDTSVSSHSYYDSSHSRPHFSLSSKRSKSSASSANFRCYSSIIDYCSQCKLYNAFTLFCYFKRR